MTLLREDGQVELVCDVCDEAWPETHDAEDFEILLADAKADGWRASRIEGEWRHRCPACVKANRTIPTAASPASGLFGENLPIKRKPRS